MVAGKTPAAPSGLALPIKDNQSFLEAARGTGIRTPLAEIIRANLAQASKSGGAKNDWSTELARIARGAEGFEFATLVNADFKH